MRVPYRPDSKAGDARGESSVAMVKMPSNFRSGRGVVMEAEMRVRALEKWSMVWLDVEMESVSWGGYLVLPSRTSARP